MPELGETQQSVCEAIGGPPEANLYVSDQKDLGLLLQVQYLRKWIINCKHRKLIGYLKKPKLSFAHLLLSFFPPDFFKIAQTTV